MNVQEKKSDVEFIAQEMRKYNLVLTIYTIPRFNKEITILTLGSAQILPLKVMTL